MFHFSSNRRQAKPIRDNISDPLSPAEIKYVEARTADDASRSQNSTRGRRAEQPPRSRPSMASINTYDSESKYSVATSASPECLQKGSARPDRPVGSRTVPYLHQSQLKREQSSSTLRSYYDRIKSPLAVSQQTSASSARDFALRKGYPPVIPALPSDVSCPQKSASTASTHRGASKKRPSRLDFSMLFPKPLPRSGPLLSPRRYTDSPPPLSATSEVPCKETPPQSFLHDKEAREVQERVSPPHAQRLRQPSRTADPSFAKINVQQPRLGAQNWFDGLEGDISEDDAEREPAMQADFVETAFQSASSKVSGDIAFRPNGEPGKQIRADHGVDCHSSGGRQSSTSPTIEAAMGNQLREALRKWERKKKVPPGGTRSPMGRSHRSASTTFDLTDLRVDSVLCLSSSDDEDVNVHKEDQRQIRENRGPFLRDSIGVDSIDSDVEIGTAQAVNTSFLRTLKPLVQSSRLRGSSLMKQESKVQRLKTVEIPDRRSSRQGVPSNEHQMIFSNPDDGVPPAPFIDRGDHESLSSKRSARTAQAVAQKQSPLMMALTPQEVSLLEAMRSKRASMGQNIFNDSQRDVANEGSPSSSPSVPQPHNFRTRSIDNRPVRLDADSSEVKRNWHANQTSTEPSLPSGRVSLIFSESVSSPTTGCDSPATPTLDLTHDLNCLHNPGNCHDSGFHSVNANPFGHAQCRTGSKQIIVLDNFQQPHQESVTSEEYSWILGQFTERSNQAMIH